MTHSPQVVGLGYCTYDILAIVPGPPRFDDVAGIHLSDMVHDGGGQVGTALSALARLSVRTGYLGALGIDREGTVLLDQFHELGVDTTRIRVSGQWGTNVCLILVDATTAQRAILCHRRVDHSALQLDEQDRRIIHSAKVLHLDGQFMPAAIEAAQWAREAGVQVCYDGNHPRPDLDKLIPHVSWLVVAEPFPRAYTGAAELSSAVHSLLADGPEIVVVTMGRRGCQVWTATQHLEIPGFEVDAIDTTGAGDAFHGAFIYGMLQGWSLARVAQFANAVGAINCRTLGGRRGLPTATETWDFIRAHHKGGRESDQMPFL